VFAILLPFGALALDHMHEPNDGKDRATGDDPPVTGVASRRVEPGREEEFEEWASGILGAIKEFPGYLGSDVLRPSDNEDDEYRMIYRFDHTSNLKRWEESEERRNWLRRAEPLVREENVQVLTGLETWFTLPSKPGEPSPPRYKMAVVTWLAVFPTITAIFLLLGPVINSLPFLLRTCLLTLIMVSLMTYVVMPRMTRLFSFWLYPARKR
jgi:hypothetical protein